MNIDVIYSYLINASWLFLAAWIVLLALAFTAVFAEPVRPTRLPRSPQK